MPRIARVVAAGLPHHVTQRGNNRGPVFFDDDDRRFYLWTLAEYRRKYGVGIWGYCLMTNHLHALAVPIEPDSLARCFAGTDLVYTQHDNRKYARSGRLWQNQSSRPRGQLLLEVHHEAYSTDKDVAGYRFDTPGFRSVKKAVVAR